MESKKITLPERVKNYVQSIQYVEICDSKSPYSIQKILSNPFNALIFQFFDPIQYRFDKFNFVKLPDCSFAITSFDLSCIYFKMFQHTGIIVITITGSTS